MKNLRRLAFLLFLIIFIGGIQKAWALAPYVSYFVTETHKTESQHRAITTQIFLTPDGYLGYRYSESVLGSREPVVTTTSFDNSYKQKVSPEHWNKLVSQLLNAKVFALMGEENQHTTDYYSHLRIRIGSRDSSYNFYTPPEGTRKVIHNILLDFAKEMKIDQPSDPQAAITKVEGDLVSPQEVSLNDILAEPARYHGKRVSVIGYYDEKFESHGLFPDKKASKSPGRFFRGIWRGEPSSFAKKSKLQDKKHGWLHVEGTFLKGPAGHKGAWLGKIVRLTLIEPVSSPVPH